MADQGLPPDDETIYDDDVLLRRVHPQKVVPDGAGGFRLSGSIFEDLTDPETGTKAMSVLVEWLLEELGGAGADLVRDQYAGWGLVAVRAREIRECGLTVCWAPSEHEGRYADAHAHVFGKKRGSTQHRLRDTCEQRMLPSTCMAKLSGVLPRGMWYAISTIGRRARLSARW